VAAGALPDGTPVIISGGGLRDGTMRVWRTADGTLVGKPLTGYEGRSGGGGRDGTVRVWQIGDGTLVVPPLNLPERIGGVAVHGDVLITVAEADTPSTSQPSRGPCAGRCSVARNNARPVKRSDNGRLSGTTQAPASDHAGGGPPPGA